MPKKKTSFETDIARLEEIVEHVEDSDTSLETAIKLYKEGLELVSKCSKTLGQYEEDIQTLQKDVNGNFIMQAFNHDNA